MTGEFVVSDDNGASFISVCSHSDGLVHLKTPSHYRLITVGTPPLAVTDRGRIASAYLLTLVVDGQFRLPTEPPVCTVRRSHYTPKRH